MKARSLRAVASRRGAWYKVPMRFTVHGTDFDGLEPGANPLADAAASLQLVACGVVPERVRLATGIESGPVLAIEAAEAVATAYGVDRPDLLRAWSTTFGHDLAALAEVRSLTVPPRSLTPDELVEGL